MKICRVRVRVQPEGTYWRRQVRRLQAVENARAGGKQPRLSENELVFESLTDMARALTPRRLELLRVVRRETPSSLRELAELAGRDIKNVTSDVKALETLGLIESEGGGGARRRKAPRAAFERIEVQVEL